MSQEMIGLDLGFTQRKVSDLERKGINSLYDLEAIAEYFDLNISEIMKRAEEKRTENE